jgi:radical SAM superfamily enzyme YgiQ (UPF0313 family)
MKVLLVNCPIRLDARPNNIPYGLATIAAMLRGAGFEVEILDLNALRPSPEAIEDLLARTGWDVAGVSGLVTTFAFQVWLIDLLKRIRPDSPVVSGGGLATSSSDLLFHRSAVDICALGEGEQTMLDLCRTLAEGGDLDTVPAIRYRRDFLQDAPILATPDRPTIPDLDGLPFPAWDLLPMDVYLDNPVWGDTARNSSGFKAGTAIGRSMNIISSRGCPYACNYCYHLFGRSSYRFRSAEHVVAEIETLVDRYGVEFIGFVDDNMMASEQRLLRFCDLLEARRVRITWGCHGRVTSARPEVLGRMAETGCVWIGYGIESGSQDMLDAMNKNSTVARAGQAIRDTRASGIFANTTFIFGYPGETRRTIQETVEFKRSLDLACGSFFATPYPGTPLYESFRDRIPDEETFICTLANATDFSVNLTDFEDAELFELKGKMDRNEDVL